MTIWRLLRKEILHRNLNFALAVLSVVAAVGVLVAAVTLLRAHDVRTEAILKAKADQAETRLAEMEDDYRKYMKQLGFNLLILPANQQLAEFWERGYATHSMPQANVTKLADSGTNSIRHLLPIVQQKVYWPERKRRIILIGTRGEVPLRHRKPKEPMLLAVPEGKAVIGYELASDLALEPGDEISLLGRRFVIERCRRQRGSAEDATIWVDLPAAQQLLDMEGRINAIEALQCFCWGAGPSDLIDEIGAILPDTKVVLRENKVTIRAEARSRAKTEHHQAVAAEKANRVRLRRARESLAAVGVPVVILGSAAWVGLLALSNVRRRRGEIGILRAVGLRSRQILTVLLVRAGIIGFLGGLVGCGVGLAAGIAAAQVAGERTRVESVTGIVPFGLLILAPLAAPILSAAASWVPAVLAGRQDPAVVLREE